MIYMENELIGNRLKKMRRKNGMECGEVARALGVSEGHYRKIERGMYGLDLRKVYILEKDMGINVSYLLYGDEMERNVVHYPNIGKERKTAYVCQMLEYCQKNLETDAGVSGKRG